MSSIPELVEWDSLSLHIPWSNNVSTEHNEASKYVPMGKIWEINFKLRQGKEQFEQDASICIKMLYVLSVPEI